MKEDLDLYFKTNKKM